jgi:hypothetical protein
MDIILWYSPSLPCSTWGTKWHALSYIHLCATICCSLECLCKLLHTCICKMRMDYKYTWKLLKETNQHNSQLNTYTFTSLHLRVSVSVDHLQGACSYKVHQLKQCAYVKDITFIVSVKQ